MRNKVQFWVCLAVAVIVSLYFGNELYSLKKMNNRYKFFFSNIEKRYQGSNPWFARTEGEDPWFRRIWVPSALRQVPFAEDTGLVLDTKRIFIRGVVAPYNASIISYLDGYLIFFRYDVKDYGCSHPFYTYIGCAKLNENFEQTSEEFRRIDTGSSFSEDPRVVKIGNEICLVFNDFQESGFDSRTMRIGRLNLEESKLDFVTNLDMQIKPIEKNWVPFEFVDHGKPCAYFEYNISPRKVISLEDISSSKIISVPAEPSITYQKIQWPELWGAPRGGATAQKLEDRYLSFFHSSFVDSKGLIWYVMGAYTFEETPPFRLTGISHYPILFKDIYDTPPMNTADANKRVIFPGSVCLGTWKGMDVIHLVCGENDCAIKIVTFHKRNLYESLKKI